MWNLKNKKIYHKKRETDTDTEIASAYKEKESWGEEGRWGGGFRGINC